MSNKLKSFKNLIAMSALSAVASFGNTAKAETNMGEIQDVTQTPNGTLIIKKNADAEIGGVKTPWMFARPDGQSAFANHFTTNATEVVSDGSNVYAHVKGKITHFTLSPDGIPSTNGVEYTLTNADGTQTNTCEKLLATHNGELYTIDDTTNKEDVVFFNRYTNNNERCFAVDRSWFPDDYPTPEVIKSNLGLLQEEVPSQYYDQRYEKMRQEKLSLWKTQINPNLEVPVGLVKDSSYAFDSNGEIKLEILLPSVQIDFGQNDDIYYPNKVSSESTNILATGSNFIIGYINGDIAYGTYRVNTRFSELEKPITGLSQLTNGNIVACSEGYGCVELDWNNWCQSEAHTAPAITNAPKDTFKIIDNRGKPNGALLYVTKEKIGILSR